jgi:ATP adenylyltransferase/5',5'''-P-1,P-4-tetraphosphate phosphorylase II
MRLPFQHYVSSLPENKHAASLYRTYRRLVWDMKRGRGPTAPTDSLSYNYVMTTQWMFICPRSTGDFRDQGREIGVNSTGMVGLLLTKSQDESDFVEQYGPGRILSFVGEPWPSQSNEREGETRRRP